MSVSPTTFTARIRSTSTRMMVAVVAPCTPPKQDWDLIRGIRQVRPFGPVRVVVNPAGLVLTKAYAPTCQHSEDNWLAVFVGSINPNLWFEEE